MAITHKFPVAIHLLVLVALEGKDKRVTSDYIASSTGINPVIIRNCMSDLKRANLIDVKRGSGGISISKAYDQLTLLDIFLAINGFGKNNHLFSIHENPNPECKVGKNISEILDTTFLAIEDNVLKELQQVSLKDILKKF